MLLALAPVLSSCEGVIYDDEGDCSVNYQVRFIDDMNLKFTDAFNEEVTSVTLYAFDDEGTLVWSGSDSGDAIHPSGGTYAMSINALQPGNYHLIAWAGLKDNNAFTVPDMVPGVSKMTDLTCTMQRTRDNEGESISSTNLDPVFFGSADITIPETDDPGTHTFPVYLIKDTNGVNVVLQQLDGEELDPDDYEFVIETDNAHINYDNSLIAGEEPFLYNPWEQASGSATIGSNESMTYSGGDEEYSAHTSVVAHLSISRLVQQTTWRAYTRPTLTVYKRSSGETILSVPIIDYALLVRGYYPQITSTQEYLDRQDDYNMTFFLRHGRWMSSVIIINAWRIVLNNDNV
jgi:hypothetical protein